jgi:hypothetical protein
MDDSRIWQFEESLWKASEELYRHRIAEDAQFVVPNKPFVLSGTQAAEAMATTPRWDDIAFTDQRVSRPHEGLIVIAYHAEARKGDETYTAWCTTTMLRHSHDDWVVIQHQQTPPLSLGSSTAPD